VLARLGVAWSNKALPPLLQCCLSLRLTPMGLAPALVNAPIVNSAQALVPADVGKEHIPADGIGV
jgi:hypothetical protein